MRKLAGTLLAVAIAAAGVIGLIAFFNSRDESTTSSRTPTTVTARAPSDGNVVLTYSDAALQPRLKALAADLGAPDTPELRAAGLAVIVRRDPNAAGIVARAAGHELAVAEPDDPQLQDFIDRWLGEGAAG
jgi:hypothetical protein